MTREPASDADDEQLDDALAAARPAESPALVLARARIAGQLFGGEATGLGRFRVLERLGGGGMGVVYAAYDPELDRGVALKTVHLPKGGRELALREAKALAKLSHPNVVPVFDVGLAGEHVYIVMELVRGETLRAFVAGKPLAAIVDAYRQAGQALAAAHAVGLVHRDFKPDNAIAGADGRVRVVDFGLACEAEAERVGGAGTPKYMAPEQAKGGAVTPAADQYSFAVSLGEAVATIGTVPRWIAAIVERGSAELPGERFRSMAELLRALGRDRRRRWVAAGIVAAIAVVGASAFAIGQRAIDEPEPCIGGDREIAAAWEPAARDAQLARIAALSPYGAKLAPQLEQVVRDHATAWAGEHRDACLAHRRGVLADAFFERRMACLDRSRTALATLADLATAADAKALFDIGRVGGALGDPRACSDPRVLISDVEPPPPAAAAAIGKLDRDLERARVEIVAGHFADAQRLAVAAVTEARALGYRPMLAEALLVESRTLMEIDERAAIARLAETVSVALASGNTAIGIEAWARRAWLISILGQPAQAFAGRDVIEALTARTPAVFPRALLDNNIGSVELALGHRSAARAAFERSRDEARGLTGAGAIELLATRMNLALVVDDLAERDALLADWHAAYAKLLGPEHPDTLRAEVGHAMIAVASLPRAAALLEPACTGSALYEPNAERTAKCWVELADLHAGLGDMTRALSAIDRAVVLLHAQPALVGSIPEAEGYAALWRGDPAAAASQFARALDGLAPQHDEPWFVAYSRARVQLGLARTRRIQGREHDAVLLLVPAIATLATITREHPVAAYQRRLGEAQVELALAHGGDPRAALAWLRSVDGAPAEIAALERLTATPAPNPVHPGAP